MYVTHIESKFPLYFSNISSKIRTCLGSNSALFEVLDFDSGTVCNCFAPLNKSEAESLLAIGITKKKISLKHVHYTNKFKE